MSGTTPASRHRAAGIALALGVAFAPAVPANAVDVLPASSPFFVLTDGSTTGLAAGDWYTTPVAGGGGGGSHYVTFDVPCGWPGNQPLYLDIFSPRITTAAGSKDTVTGTADSTEFELYGPGASVAGANNPAPGTGIAGYRLSYQPDTTAPSWESFAQILGPGSDPGLTCGRYVLRSAVLGGDPFNAGGGTDDKNFWTFRLGTDNDTDPSNAPPANTDNFDLLPGTGDEVTAGLTNATVQQSSGGTACLTLHEYVQPNRASITLNNFGMGSGRVRYYAPSDTYDATATVGGTAGTVSGATTWNNSATTARGGDVILTPESGWWREVWCVPSGAQFVPEGRANVTGYLTQPPTPDLTASASDGVTTLARGATRTTTLTATNASSGATAGTAKSVVVTDTLPAGETFASCSVVAPATGTCTHSAGVVTATLTSEVDAGSAAQVQVVTTVGNTAAGTLTHSFAVAYTDGLGNAFPQVSTTESDSVVTADLAVAIADSPDPVLSGLTLTYAVDVTNAGPDAAPATTVTLPLSAGTTATGASGTGWTCTTGATVSCTAGSLPLGAAPTITVTATVTAPSGTLTATATVSSRAADPAGSDNTATASTTVSSAADLSLTKQHIGSFTAGSTGSYLLTVTNAGPSPANPPTTVTDTLPAGLTYVAASGAGWVCSALGQVVTCTRSTPLASGATSTLTLTVDVAATTAASVTNTASVSSASSDPDASNNDASDQTDVDNSGVSGTVWNDLDGDGTRDAGEPAFAGRTVTATGPVTRTTTSAADGTYSFAGLVAGTYNVSVSRPAKYVSTTPNPTTLTLAADERVTGTDFGLVYQNLSPVAINDAKTTAEDTATTVSVLANDSDPDGDAFTITAHTDGAAGAVSCTSTTCTYTPDPNANGTDTFTYTVSDPDGATSTATVTITITAVNDAPAYTAAAANTSQTVPVGGTLSALAVTDVDGDPLSFTLIAGALPPTVTLNPDGSFAGGASPHGTYSATIRVSDGNGGTATTTLSITVGGPTANTPPSAGNDTATTAEDNPVAVSVLTNDSDVDDDALAVSAKTNGAFGTVSCTASSCTYTPAANANGTDTFTYTVTDGIATATATVTVTVTPVNDAPGYTAAASNTSQTVPVGGSLSSLAATDVDLDPLTYTLLSGTLPPGITLTSGGGLTGTANAPGAYSVTIRVSDGNGGTDTTTLALQVGGPTANTPPDAKNDAPSTAEDTPVTVDVLGNDVDVDLDTLTVTGHGNASFGTVSCTATTCTYTPNANFNGSDSFTYDVADGSGGTDSATVAVTVTPVNDPPKFTAAGRNTAQTVPVGGTLQALSASDVDNDPLTYAVVSGTLPPGVTLTTAGALTGTANAPGTYVVTIRVSDGAGGTDDTVLTLTIGGPTANTPPVAADDTKTTPEDTAALVAVLGNDSDVDLDTLTVTGWTNGAFGTVSCSSSSCTYTPAANANGTDTFTYTIADGSGGTDTGVVTVTVTPVNDAPVAGNDARSTAEDTAFTMTALRNNDSDVDGDALTIASFTQPSHGSVVCTPTACTYTPAADYFGSDAFTYTVSDGNGGTSTATVTMTVTPVNDAPVAVGDARSTAEDTAIVVAVLGNDTDVEANPLTIVSSTPASAGTAVCGAATCTYTPGPDYDGSDSFTYTISDGAGGTATATVSITVTPVNDAPVAVGDVRTTAEDTAIVIAVRGNDSDVDGDPLAIVSSTDPAHGTVSCSATVCTYTPALNYNGPDSFTYTISDGAGGTATATVTLTVTAVNDAPVAVGDTLTTAEDNAATLSVTDNDTDVEGDLLVVVSWTAAAHGLVTCAGATCSYAPDADYHGPDSFTYTVSDGNGGTATATVSVTVTPVNDAPVLGDDSDTTAEDTPVTTDVLANDSDIDGDPLTVVSWTSGAHGSVVCDASGCTYSPGLDYNGPDSYTYTVSDGTTTVTATVTLTVTAVNDAPVAGDDAAVVDEDGSVDTSVLLNDTDVDLDPLVVSAVTQPAHGSVTCDASVCTYVPEADYHGPDAFTYTVSDGAGGAATGTVLVTVAPVNDAPVALDDAVVTAEDTPVLVPVLANDSDIDGDALTVTVTLDPLHGTVVCDPSGCTYTPDANYEGDDAFGYAVSDGAGGVANAVATITVTPVNDPPLVVPDTGVVVVEGRQVTINVVKNDSDADGDALTILSWTQGAHGTVTCEARRCTYVADAGYAGADTFTYTVTDGHGGTSVGHVSLLVKALPPPPAPGPGPGGGSGGGSGGDPGVGSGGSGSGGGLPLTGGEWLLLLALGVVLVAVGAVTTRAGRSSRKR